MTGPDSASGIPQDPGGGRRSWRRRRIVVDARYQLRAGVLVGAVAVVLLILLNASLLSQGRSPLAGPSAPSGPRATQGGEGTSWALLLVGSGVFLAGVIAVGILESHRTAGAAYAIRRSIDQIREGRPGVRVRLRRGDHLQDLAKAINQLAETLDVERSRRA